MWNIMHKANKAIYKSYYYIIPRISTLDEIHYSGTEQIKIGYSCDVPYPEKLCQSYIMYRIFLRYIPIPWWLVYPISRKNW